MMPSTRANPDIPVGSIRPNVVLPAESVIRLSPPQYRYSAYGTTMAANRSVARPSLQVSFISHLLLPHDQASPHFPPVPEVTSRRGLVPRTCRYQDRCVGHRIGYWRLGCRKRASKM